MKVIILLILIALVIGILLICNYKPLLKISEKEHALALQALYDLNILKHIPNVTKEELENFQDDILLVKKSVGERNKELKENMEFSHPVDTKYWPYYYYTFPYTYESGGGAWPPGMYSRLYNWYPGFNESGWQFYMRPGVEYEKWPRSRWVRNDGDYYYINNGKNQLRKYDFYNNKDV